MSDNPSPLVNPRGFTRGEGMGEGIIGHECFVIIKNTMILTYLRSMIKGIVLMAYSNVYILMHGEYDSY